MVKKNRFSRYFGIKSQPSHSNTKSQPTSSIYQSEFGSLGQRLQQVLQQRVAQPNRLQIRCAIREGVLLVLVEHLLHVEPESQQTFLVLEQVVRECVPDLVASDPDCKLNTDTHPLPIRLYLRVAGYQQPYAFHSFTIETTPSPLPPQFQRISNAGIAFPEPSIPIVRPDPPSLEPPAEAKHITELEPIAPAEPPEITTIPELTTVVEPTTTLQPEPDVIEQLDSFETNASRTAIEEYIAEDNTEYTSANDSNTVKEEYIAEEYIAEEYNTQESIESTENPELWIENEQDSIILEDIDDNASEEDLPLENILEALLSDTPISENLAEAEPVESITEHQESIGEVKDTETSIELEQNVVPLEDISSEYIFEENISSITAETLAAEPIPAEPVVEESIAEEPILEEPIAEIPIVEETIVENSIAEISGIEESVVETSIAEIPIVEETIPEEPIAVEPVEAVTEHHGLREVYLSETIEFELAPARTEPVDLPTANLADNDFVTETDSITSFELEPVEPFSQTIEPVEAVVIEESAQLTETLPSTGDAATEAEAFELPNDVLETPTLETPTSEASTLETSEIDLPDEIDLPEVSAPETISAASQPFEFIAPDDLWDAELEQSIASEVTDTEINFSITTTDSEPAEIAAEPSDSSDSYADVSIPDVFIDESADETSSAVTELSIDSTETNSSIAEPTHPITQDGSETKGDFSATVADSDPVEQAVEFPIDTLEAPLFEASEGATETDVSEVMAPEITSVESYPLGAIAPENISELGSLEFSAIEASELGIEPDQLIISEVPDTEEGTPGVGIDLEPEEIPEILNVDDNSSVADVSLYESIEEGDVALEEPVLEISQEAETTESVESTTIDEVATSTQGSFTGVEPEPETNGHKSDLEILEGLTYKPVNQEPANQEPVGDEISIQPIPTPELPPKKLKTPKVSPLLIRPDDSSTPTLVSSSLDQLPLEIDQKRRRAPSLATIMLSGAVGLFFVVSGAYAVTRPCVVGAVCLPLEQAQQLSQRALTTIQTNPDALEVVDAYDQLTQAIEQLKTIPSWSRHYQTAQTLITEYSSKTEVLGVVVQALNQANTATRKSLNPPHPVQTWREIQFIWREAISTLEKIPADSLVYPLAQSKLQEYRSNLDSINHRIVTEQDAQQRLDQVKQAANVTEARSQIVNSTDSWQQTITSWNTLLDQLKQIPQGTSAYTEAQRLLTLYGLKLENAEKQLSQSQLSTSAYTEASNLAEQARRAEQQGNWSQATALWRDAITALKKIPEGTTYYSQAQTLLQPYTTSLNQSESNLKRTTLTQTVQPQLDRLCSGIPRTCTFTIATEAMRIQLTPGYDQLVKQVLLSSQLQGNSTVRADVARQVNQLLQSLGTVSQSAQVPLELYDSTGSRFATYDPTRGGYIAQ